MPPHAVRNVVPFLCYVSPLRYRQFALLLAACNAHITAPALRACQPTCQGSHTLPTLPCLPCAYAHTTFAVWLVPDTCTPTTTHTTAVQPITSEHTVADFWLYLHTRSVSFGTPHARYMPPLTRVRFTHVKRDTATPAFGGLPRTRMRLTFLPPVSLACTVCCFALATTNDPHRLDFWSPTISQRCLGLLLRTAGPTHPPPS